MPTPTTQARSKRVRLVERQSGKVLLSEVKWCRSRLCRLVGYQFRRRLNLDEALVMVYPKDSVSATSIHMFFVFTPLAVVWINSLGRVTSVQLAKPWRPYYASPEPASYVLEAHPAFLSQLHPGDEVDFLCD
jgi:uncharacterized membrane protein (UPF0127 family)